MAIEEVSRTGQYKDTAVLTEVQEFSIEIPDKEADAILSGKYLSSICLNTHTDDITVKQAVDYILRQPDGKLEHAEVQNNDMSKSLTAH